MSVLSGIEPQNVFRFFQEISNIPHPSYKEKEISDYCVKFAKDRGLWVKQDDLYNVIIIKEATLGYEDVVPIIIQGHIDMVCEKETNLVKNMDLEPIELYIDGDFIKARGTTLGGDDGIAVAYALAILDSNIISHPRIEVVLTVSEEVGMEGAAAIDLSMLKGKILLNIDSEEEGIFLTSCAGGARAAFNMPVTIEKIQSSRKTIEISISGLLGGHSGVDIDKNRSNANKLMGVVLNKLFETDIQYNICHIAGGKKDNVITSQSKVIIAADDIELVKKEIASIEAELKKEIDKFEPDFAINTSPREWKGVVASIEASKLIVKAINDFPNGIIAMSKDIDGLVETSLNLGVLELIGEELHISFAVRSSLKSDKELLIKTLQEIALSNGGTITISGQYPAWEYMKDSSIRNLMIDTYKDMYGKNPEIQAIHAGLECGILSSKILNLDCVAFGPDIYDIHSVKERLSISSTKRVWEFILEVLKRTKDL